MTTCAEWTTKLAAAEAALEALRFGGKVVSIRLGDKEVKYSPGSLNDLIGYVRYLQGKVDVCNGTTGGSIVHFTPVDC